MDEKKYEDLLKSAFRQNARTPKSWSDNVYKRLHDSPQQNKAFRWRKRRLLLIILILAFAVPAAVFAGFKLLNPGDAALLMGEDKLAEAFGKEETEIVTKEDGDYTVSLLGMVSGQQLDKFPSDEEIDQRRTYAIIAVQRTDGTPIEDYDNPDISISPVIEGLDPVRWNTAAFGTKWQKKIEGGVLYCIAEWDDIQMFGYKKVYIAVMENDFLPSRELFVYDEKTGEITANEQYDKVNLLFEMETDQSKVDRDAAEKWMAEKETEWTREDGEQCVQLNYHEVTKEGITFMTMDQLVPQGEKIKYWFNFYVDGADVQKVYLQCSKGTLIQPQRISRKDFDRLTKERADGNGELDWFLQKGYGDVYRFADYSQGKSRIKVDTRLLTKEMYREEDIHGLIDQSQLGKLSIKIIVEKKDGSQVAVTAAATASEVDETGMWNLLRFNFK